MTNKEKYQRTFSALHASGDFIEEIETMKKTKKRTTHRFVAIAAVIVLIVALSGVAYATDLGGIQRTVQIWFHGDPTDAVFEVENGEYTLTYEDENGETHTQQGGGKAFDIFGRERELTEEELMINVNSPEVVYNDDGSVWVYYMDQKIDITDKFDENGTCYVQLKDGDTSIYMTIDDDGGYSMNTNKYVLAD